MGRYKLIALDMDGTLLNSEHEVSEENREWMMKALDAGVTVILSTGRGVQNVYPYTDKLNLNTPIVAVNGSEVWEAPRRLLKRHLLSVDSIMAMHELAVRYDTWFWSYAVEGVFNKETWLTGDPNAVQWLKFGYFTDNDESRARILEWLQAEGIYEVTNSHPHNLEINPKGISKASGIREVCALLGIDMSEVVAMGDSLNDMAMIKEAGLGVAMGNAQDALKAAADLVTVTNNENAIAKVIREHVLT
ncbi:Cof-type HAD-IIB family hydrolase [Paenibacillus flagellatus]|uniref:Phosphoglycolate phosphatase n=1 Tax=Paenibacillus flagellatus TaxID=2211139 RepID=A0A2V5KRD9_9BACL|nr:Cof-type HAD-IIB family hydrolase [Paenibacillus flagellatus]PYI54007.1 phosphoglycolate phosphatase [Paenibacillus flagellatus]